jgi:hypothetical protein
VKDSCGHDLIVIAPSAGDCDKSVTTL